MTLKRIKQRIEAGLGTFIAGGPNGTSVYDVLIPNKQPTTIRVLVDVRGFIITKLPQRTTQELNSLLGCDFSHVRPMRVSA
jgi:hypothetical protein